MKQRNCNRRAPPRKRARRPWRWHNLPRSCPCAFFSDHRRRVAQTIVVPLPRPPFRPPVRIPKFKAPPQDHR